MENKELSQLKTQQMGATKQHETKTAEQSVQINPPKSGPGQVDMRSVDTVFNQSEKND